MLLLSDLPNEIIAEIGQWVDYSSLASLAATSQHFCHLLQPRLYERDAKHDHSRALLWAAEKGLLETAKLCVKFGADVNTGGPDAETPEQAERGRSNTIRYGTPLHYAVRAGYTDIVVYLLGCGAEVNRPSKGLCRCDAQYVRDDMGDIYYHIEQNGLDEEDELNKIKQELRWLPLHLALCCHQQGIAEILLDGGARYDTVCHPMIVATGPAGHVKPRKVYVQTCLQAIVSTGSIEVLDLLLRKEFPLQQMINVDGWSIMHHLAKTGTCSDLVDRLMALGADIEFDRAINGRGTPLQLALSSHHYHIVLRLHHLGARYPQFSQDGRFVYQLNEVCFAHLLVDHPGSSSSQVSAQVSETNSDVRKSARTLWEDDRAAVFIWLLRDCIRNERLMLTNLGPCGVIARASSLTPHPQGPDLGPYETPVIMSNELQKRVQQAGIFTSCTEIFYSTARWDLTAVLPRNLLIQFGDEIRFREQPGSSNANLLVETLRCFMKQGGVRWDTRDEYDPSRRDQMHDLSLLDITVRMYDYVDPQLRSSMIDALLSAGTNLDESEKEHLNQAARYAYDRGNMAVYHQLVRHGAVPMESSENKAAVELSGDL